MLNSTTSGSWACNHMGTAFGAIALIFKGAEEPPFFVWIGRETTALYKRFGSDH